MPLPLPNLDDRDYEKLRDDALKIIKDKLNADWSDPTVSDPGLVLLEAFAFLTEQMIYRLNRVPDKVYTAFLRMLGVSLKPPRAARVLLSFWQKPPAQGKVEIPSGTQVATNSQGGEALVFTTVRKVVVGQDNCSKDTAKKVMAIHNAWVEEDLPELSTGLPGQVFTISQPPILENEYDLKLRLGVEVSQKSEEGDTVRYIEHWEEVPNWPNPPDIKAKVFRVDRQAGTIQFAPTVSLYPKGKPAAIPRKKPLAAVPDPDARIRVKYPIPGAEVGKVYAGQIQTILDQSLSAKVEVTNQEPPSWQEAETLENALIRGPHEIFTQDHLITAHDFEHCAGTYPGIARTLALAPRNVWVHGAPGEVIVSLVPSLPKEQYPTGCTQENIETVQNDLTAGSILTEVEGKMTKRSPLGINARAVWAHYKRVKVTARITFETGEDSKDKAKVKKDLEDMLYRAICPLDLSEEQPTSPDERAISPLRSLKKQSITLDEKGDAQPVKQNGWSFGAPLNYSEVSRWIYTTAPNVGLDSLELSIDSAPDENIAALVADHYQPKTWYAASKARLFRTTNDAAGWEELLDFSPNNSNPRLSLETDMKIPDGGQVIKKICPSPYKAGLVAMAALDQPDSPLCSYLYLSTDCGESWQLLADYDTVIDDMDWLQRTDQHILLLATSTGLKEEHFIFNSKGRPKLGITNIIPVVEEVSPTLPVEAVKVLTGRGGTARVAVAVSGRRGVYLSNGIDLAQSGNKTAFTRLVTDSTDPIPPDIRCLGVQWCEKENLFLLWAGSMALGREDYGDGCCCWIFDDRLNSRGQTGRWYGRNKNWNAGSCLGLAFLGNQVMAATTRGTILLANGVLATKGATEDVVDFKWSTVPNQNRNLPEPEQRFEKIEMPFGGSPLRFTAIASNDRLKIQPQEQMLLVGCEKGVFFSLDQGNTFHNACKTTFNEWGDKITIPPDWQLVSGKHSVQEPGEEDAGTGQEEGDHATE